MVGRGLVAAAYPPEDLEGLAARTGEPLSVFLGAWLALIVVAGIAVLVGGWLQQRVALWRIRLVSAVVLTGLAAWTLVEFVQA